MGRGAGWDSAEKPPWAERRQGPQFLVCCPGIMQELRSWVPAWLVWLPLTQVALNPAPTLPSLAGTPALSYWPTPYKKTQNTEEKTMIITKRMKEPTNQSNPWRRPLPLLEANCSSVLLHLRTLAQQDPAAPPTGRCSPQSVFSLTQGSPWQRLGVVLWTASEVLASLSCHSCH